MTRASWLWIGGLMTLLVLTFAWGEGKPPDHTRSVSVGPDKPNQTADLVAVAPDESAELQVSFEQPQAYIFGGSDILIRTGPEYFIWTRIPNQSGDQEYTFTVANTTNQTATTTVRVEGRWRPRGGGGGGGTVQWIHRWGEGTATTKTNEYFIVVTPYHIAGTGSVFEAKSYIRVDGTPTPVNSDWSIGESTDGIVFYSFPDGVDGITFIANEPGEFTVTGQLSTDLNTSDEEEIVVLKAEIEDSSTDSFSPHLKETATLNIKVEPPPPEDGYTGLFLKLEIVRKLKDVDDPQHIQWIEVDSAEPKYMRALDFHTQAFEWDGIASAAASSATGPDKFDGIQDQFYRKLPSVEAEKPVPPPLYHAVARVENEEGLLLFASEPRPIYVPQVVLIELTSGADFWLGEQRLTDNDPAVVVVEAFTEAERGVLPGQIRDHVSNYFSDVNARIVSSDASLTGDYTTIKLQPSAGNTNIWGSATLNFGNTTIDLTGYVFVENIRDYLEDSYAPGEPDPVDIPFTKDEQIFAFSYVAAHELGHMLGLVKQNAVLNGGDFLEGNVKHTAVIGHHNPWLDLDAGPNRIMNYSFLVNSEQRFETLEHRVGRDNPAWRWRETNENYLKFVLPKPQE